MCFPLLLLCFNAPLAAEDTSNVLKNIDSQAKLVETITRTFIERASISTEESLAVHFQSMDDGWMIQHTVLQSLQKLGYVVRSLESGDGNSWLLEIGGVNLGVQYTDLHRDGFLGTKKVIRKVTAKLDCRILDKKSGIYRLNDSFSQTTIDTIQVEEIEALESGGSTSAKGVVPSDDFLDHIVEPFIIIGATGIAVYLLFNIRSS